ncbi:ABC transporter permease [bacterium]|nr:ABC transporter permease [bacterium]
MFRNYFKIALRNLLKHRGYSFINISGLAVGIACCILIMLFVLDELSYDQHLENVDRIYRVQTDVNVSGNILDLATTSFPMAGALKADYSQIQDIARMVKWGEPVLSLNEVRFKEKSLYWADASIFRIFSWSFVEGDPQTALTDVHSIVLTESTAKKYFGNESPLGKTLRYENRDDFKITGVIKDLPNNSTFKFDCLASSLMLHEIMGKETMEQWHGFYPTETFATIQSKEQADDLSASLPHFVSKYLQDDMAKTLGRTYSMSLQPLLKIHLSPQLRGEFGTIGSTAYIYTFSAIAVCVLLIACINFMNLSTARSARRSKEIGLRKVLGALRPQLIRQFLGETFLLSIIGLLIALLLVELSLPFFNQLANKELTFGIFSSGFIFPLVAAIVLFVGFSAGMYPAFYLSKFKPVESLKSKQTAGTGGVWLRKILVSVQFAVSIILIISTLTVYRQLEFVRNQSLGLDKNQVLTIAVSHAALQQKYDVLREQLLQNPDVQNVAASTFMPGGKIMGTPIQKIPSNSLEKWEMRTIPTDHYFIPTLGIKLLAGRNYSKEIASDMTEGIIINEAAVQELGWANAHDAIGKKVEWWGIEPPVVATVIGVTENFNFASLHQQVASLVFVPIPYWPNGYNYISVRLNPEHTSSALEHVRETWEKLFPETPFAYTFLDDDFGKLYASEDRLGSIFTIFASLAIFIACLGLLGLASFTAEVRTKEIAIRKILGASVTGIVNLMSKEFIVLVLLSNIVAWPLAYYIMNSWLEKFAYRIDPSVWVFVGSGLAALMIALLTVSFQAIKAASANPVEALKYE